MLPLSYAMRNLLRSPMRLAQMLAGSALVVLLLCSAAAFGTGMQESLRAAGDPANVILLGQGSEESLERSEVTARAAGIIGAGIAGLATIAGQPAVSPEVYYNGLVTGAGERERQAILRGVTPAALAVHRQVRLVDGRLPRPEEVLVGARAHELLDLPAAALAPGQSLRFEGRQYTVSGTFIAPGTVMEAELWLPLQDLMTATQRDNLSCVVVRLGSADFADIETFVLLNRDLELAALRESDYYAGLASFFKPLRLMAWMTALLVAAGAIFGGLNTFYAAFASRIGEMGTLQAIGFRRWMILVSLLQEGLLATLGGTLIALSIGLWAIDGLAIGFSTGVFTLYFSDAVLLLGLLAGVALALIGTLPPAWRCLMAPLAQSIRAA